MVKRFDDNFSLPPEKFSADIRRGSSTDGGGPLRRPGDRANMELASPQPRLSDPDSWAGRGRARRRRHGGGSPLCGVACRGGGPGAGRRGG